MTDKITVILARDIKDPEVRRERSAEKALRFLCLWGGEMVVSDIDSHLRIAFYCAHPDHTGPSPDINQLMGFSKGFRPKLTGAGIMSTEGLMTSPKSEGLSVSMSHSAMYDDPGFFPRLVEARNAFADKARFQAFDTLRIMIDQATVDSTAEDRHRYTGAIDHLQEVVGKEASGDEDVADWLCSLLGYELFWCKSENPDYGGDMLADLVDCGMFVIDKVVYDARNYPLKAITKRLNWFCGVTNDDLTAAVLAARAALMSSNPPSHTSEYGNGVAYWLTGCSH